MAVRLGRSYLMTKHFLQTACGKVQRCNSFDTCQLKGKTLYLHTTAFRTTSTTTTCYITTTRKQLNPRTFCSSKHNAFYCTQPSCADSDTDLESENKLWTVEEAINHWAGKFAASDVPEAEISAKYIIAHAVGYKQLGDLRTNVLSRQLKHDEQNLINNLCEKRLERVPVQYIIGEWDFRNLTLLMKPPVFISCPETEELVELVVDHYSSDEKLQFLEVGCGSGAICISLLVELPQAHVTVIERSREACDLTRENATRLGVIDRLTIHHDELELELPSCLRGNRFDALVSNPPYISHEAMKCVMAEVRHQDNGAINGGKDGLLHVRNICRHATRILKPGAFIWMEIDTYQSEMIDAQPDMIDAWLRQQDIGLTLLKMYTDFADRPRFCQLQVQIDMKKGG